MTIGQAIEVTYKEITPLYDDAEARNVAVYYFEDVIGKYEDSYLLSNSEIDKWESDLKRLKTGVPLQYVTGVAHFFGYTFLVDDTVLIPRPETEELVARVLRLVKTFDRPVRIIDIGTGSGCIALTIKRQCPSTTMVTAVDLSEGAVSIAIDNSQLLDTHCLIRRIDVFDDEALNGLGPFDIVVSNPPYIPPSESRLMPPQVTKHEPHIALFVNEEDPLLFYRRMLSAPSLTAEARFFVFEINEHLSFDVAALATALHPHAEVTIHQDMQRKDRILEVAV